MSFKVTKHGEILIKAEEVKEPGKRGGKFYRTKSGKLKYGSPSLHHVGTVEGTTETGQKVRDEYHVGQRTSVGMFNQSPVKTAWRVHRNGQIEGHLGAHATRQEAEAAARSHIERLHSGEVVLTHRGDGARGLVTDKDNLVQRPESDPQIGKPKPVRQKPPMTVRDARRWVKEQDEDEHIDEKELADAFHSLYGRPPDAHDRRTGLWNLCCAAVRLK